MPPLALTKEQIFTEVMQARCRIYQMAPPTPLECHQMEGGWEMLLKREDLSPIHSYKWRGAFNFMKTKEKEAKLLGVTAASAGNHAQGVALSAARLGISAHVFMPRSAPRLKVEATKYFGGDWVEIHQIGDNFDQASQAAFEFCRENGALYVPPYDDILVMAGQGVLGDELMTSAHRPEIVFLQIGGGGMAAGVASVIKTYAPDVKVIGVEEEGQASMRAAFLAGEPVTLDHVDVFCDGTAVKRAGEKTYTALKNLLDDIVIVSTSDVAAAIEEFWRVARVLPEPSGALGLAAARKYEEDLTGKKVGIVLSGANLDFRQLASIARKAGPGSETKSYYRIKLAERPGSMLELLQSVKSLDLNISYLMYGQNDLDSGYPVIGFDGPKKAQSVLEQTLTRNGYDFADISSKADLHFRLAPFQPKLFKNPFATIIHFPERPGALTEFMERAAALASISYFNYTHTGEQVGRALVVLSFQNQQDRQKLLNDLDKRGPHHTPLEPETIEALGGDNNWLHTVNTLT